MARKSTGRTARVGELNLREYYEVDNHTEYDTKGNPVDGYSTWIEIFEAGTYSVVLNFMCSLDDFKNMKIEHLK